MDKNFVENRIETGIAVFGRDRASDMQDFLEVMNNDLDQQYICHLNMTETYFDEESREGKISFLPVTGSREEFPLWKEATASLEQNSGDDASGHNLMNYQQVLESINRYWGLHSKKPVFGLVRNGKFLMMGSKSYLPMEQSKLFHLFNENVLDMYPNARFEGGKYQTELTEVMMSVPADEFLSGKFRMAADASGYPSWMLDGSSGALRFTTSDTCDASAKVKLSLCIGGTEIPLGTAVSVMHKKGHGGILEFEKELQKINVKAEKQLELLAKLGDTKLQHPENAALYALKKCGADKVAKKACKELEKELLFMPGDSAFTVYLALCRIVNTTQGEKLAEGVKLLLMSKIYGLVTEDWSKFDRAETVIL